MRIARTLVLSGLLVPALLWGQESQPPSEEAEPAEEKPSGESGEKPQEKKDKTVVVTATRHPVLKETVGNAVTVITPEELEISNTVQVSEALRRVPGLHVVRTGGTRGTTSLFLRGSESDHTAVLLDGFRVNGDGGFFDFENLGIENMGRLEVLRGAAGPQYGSNALAGVVNLLSRKGEGPPEMSLLSEVGEFGRTLERVRFSAGKNGTGISFDATRFDQQSGRFENSDVANTAVGTRLDHRFSPMVSTYLTLRYSNLNQEIFTTANGQRFEPPDPNDYKKRDDFLAGLGIDLRPSELWESDIRLFSYRELRVSGTVKDEVEDFFGTSESITDFKRRGAHWIGRLYPTGSTVVTGGVDLEEEEVTIDSFTLWTTSTRTTDVRRLNRGYYAQVEQSIGDRVHLSGGIRHDRNSVFKPQDTYRGAVSVPVRETGTRFRASWGTGIKAPSKTEEFGFGTTPGLRAKGDVDVEKSETWDAGVEQSFWGERITAGVTYFETKIEDLVEFVNLAEGYGQGGKAETRGLEWTAAAKPFPWLEGIFSWTYLETKATETKTTGTGFVVDEPLLRRPKDTMSLVTVLGPLAGFSTELEVQYVGDRVDRDFFSDSSGRRVRNPAYTKVDWSAQYEWRGWRVFGEVENLTGEEYEEAYGFPAERRVFSGGVEYTKRF